MRKRGVIFFWPKLVPYEVPLEPPPCVCLCYCSPPTFGTMLVLSFWVSVMTRKPQSWSSPSGWLALGTKLLQSRKIQTAASACCSNEKPWTTRRVHLWTCYTWESSCKGNILCWKVLSHAAALLGSSCIRSISVTSESFRCKVGYPDCTNRFSREVPSTSWCR